MIIKLIRHGESQANAGILNPNQLKDAAIHLSDKGKKQAHDAGAVIGADYLKDALIYCSPYERTRETLSHLLDGALLNKNDVKIFEDPRLREIDVGYSDHDSQLSLREAHGWFYYRFQGGESPADCYDRTSAFLESLKRQIARSQKKKVLVVCHGMTLRCFVTRFLHLLVEDFEVMYNPDNAEIVTIDAKQNMLDPVFKNGRWGVDGIRVRHYAADKELQ